MSLVCECSLEKALQAGQGSDARKQPHPTPGSCRRVGAPGQSPRRCNFLLVCKAGDSLAPGVSARTWERLGQPNQPGNHSQTAGIAAPLG